MCEKKESGKFSRPCFGWRNEDKFGRKVELRYLGAASILYFFCLPRPYMAAPAAPKSKEEAAQRLQYLRETMRALERERDILATELSSSTGPPSPPDSKPQSLKDVRESSKQFLGNDLFLPWYFGEEEVKNLVSEINDACCMQIQNRAFIGLVQATMMGMCS